MTRIQWCAATLGIALLATACGKDSMVSPTAPGSTVSSLAVTRAATSGTSVQLTATARMVDSSSRDVTTVAVWVSSNPELATVSAAGMVNVVGSGELDVRATFENQTGTLHLQVATLRIVAITVSGGPSSSSFQLAATARLSDNSTQDVTGLASWQSSNLQLAVVSASGAVRVMGTGDVDLSATYQGIAGSLRVSVSMPTTFTLSGAITDAAGTGPISGARVEIIQIGHALSDAAGMFQFSGIPSGRTIVEVSSDGYLTWSTSLVIDGDTVLNASLTPSAARLSGAGR